MSNVGGGGEIKNPIFHPFSFFVAQQSKLMGDLLQVLTHDVIIQACPGGVVAIENWIVALRQRGVSLRHGLFFC